MKKKPDPNLLGRFGALAKPYWYSQEKRRAWGLSGLLILLLVGETAANVFFNKQSGEFTSALADGDGARFWRSVRLFCGLLVVAVPIYSYYYYVRDKLANPDQRIAEDISTFTTQTLNIMLMLAGATFQLFAFSSVLWSISHSLVLFVTLYAAAGTLVTVGVFGRKMVSLYFEMLKREANFRFGLVRIRENAESIALYRGEEREQAHVEHRFGDIFANFNELIRWGLRLNLFSYAYGLMTLALPSILIAPRVLSGELEVGRVIEAAGAFAAILGALTVFVDNLEYLSRFAAGVGRLDAFLNKLAPPQTGSHGEHSRIAMRESDCLAFDAVTLQTPDYERTLVKSLTVEVPQGEGLLVVGASGCGKSSLLRSIAGLWDAGTGTLERPNPDELLFLPQQAYMILGCLRDQLCYPSVDREVSDGELYEVLERVNLPGIVERCGGLDTQLDFDKDLSVGERQRLAFARVLLNRPRYVLLDEATSALDRENEDLLYRALIATSATIVSVSHHPALLKYHSLVLELKDDGSWNLQAAEEYRLSEETLEVQ